VLPGISTEQLRSRLNRMVADGMLTRKRFREVPPRVDYALTERARELMPVLGELARWGYEWAWGPPRESEAVDLGAIFRLAPGLVRADDCGRGTIELTVENGEVRTCYSCTVSTNGAELQESESGNSDACVAGEQSAWVRALSPEGDRRGLKISGDRDLAEKLLDCLGAESRHGAPQAAVA
jgi:hypothetical protein